MGAKDAYLIAYNSACCAGWAVVLYTSLVTLVEEVSDDGGTRSGVQGLQDALAKVYSKNENTSLHLTLAQTAALLEIAHAMLGLVRSPVMVTAMQVMSRIVALYALVVSEAAQTQWGAGLMILSWAAVEVPRYAFYIAALLTGDATKGTPYPLFWLRYSLFAILYPTGIVGELSVFLAAAADPTTAWPTVVIAFYNRVLPAVYFLGSPFMILNMAGNRKRSMKKRFAKPPPPPRGLVWPKDSKGVRSSTATNKSIIEAAVGAVSSDLAQAVRNCKNWRFQYVRHLKKMVEAQCQSPQAALAVAQAGLDQAYDLFEFVAPDGSVQSFRQAMAAKQSDSFYTHFIQGSKPKKSRQTLQIPYHGGILEGPVLKAKVQQWVEYGTIEPSCGEAILQCLDNPSWLDMSNRYFVLLGAGSAMGPLLVLLALGANVVAVDLDRPGIWKRLIGLARDSPGSITFPVKVDPKTLGNDDEALYAQAGCNLFTDTPMIRDWLLQLYKGKPFCVGCYAYLDGALHVQVSLAMDAICRDLSEKRPHTSLAYLCTPTDLHLIPQEAHKAIQENQKAFSGKLYCILMKVLSGGKYLRSNLQKPVPGQGGDYYLVNGISVAQGPNYALAKRMQHWRAITARSSKGCTVSSNIAPSTSTVSVVHNRTFAWAYEGMPYFTPFEIFAPETSNAVMSALLFYDLNSSTSWASPNKTLGNPNQLFSHGSFHGGLWRCAYEVDSIGEASVFLYFGRVAKPYAMAAGAIGAAALAYAYGS